MKKENKETLIFMLAFFGCVSGIAGAFGICLGGVKNNYNVLLASIPFWIMCVIGFIGAYLIKRNIEKNLVIR